MQGTAQRYENVAGVQVPVNELRPVQGFPECPIKAQLVSSFHQGVSYVEVGEEGLDPRLRNGQAAQLENEGVETLQLFRIVQFQRRAGSCDGVIEIAPPPLPERRLREVFFELRPLLGDRLPEREGDLRFLRCAPRDGERVFPG